MTEDEKTKDQTIFSFQAGAIIGFLVSAYYIASLVPFLSAASADPSNPYAAAYAAIASKLCFVACIN